MNEILIILQEECAEVIQAISKIHRFGLDNSHPVSKETNTDILHKEIGDMLCMIDLLIERGVLNLPDLLQYKISKREKLKIYSKITDL